jgi:Tfp pilus assembly protein PilF/MinD-like ATPase involved in chromosome partitioning or flagellar assembly
MNQEKPKAPFITFYSFKGGVGRSMALINTAGILAERGFRVLVMDLDLEAPGLSYLNPSAPDESSQQDTLKPDLQPGFVDLLSDAKARGKDGDLFALPVEELKKIYTKPYNLPEGIRDPKNSSLHIMPAGKFDADYAARFNDLNLRELYEDGLGEPLIRAFKKKFAGAGVFDYVLVDSRTGFSDEAGICTRDLADHLMILSGLNRQNVVGTCAFLKALRQASNGGKTTFDIILSPVPNGEDKLVDDREKAATEAFADAWGEVKEIRLHIPYHPQLALTEAPHIFRRRKGYLFEAYCNIELRMLTSIGHDADTLLGQIEVVLNREDYSTALDELHRLIKFNNGKNSLRKLALDLVFRDRLSPEDKAGVEITQKKAALDKLLDDEKGRRVLEFLIDGLPLMNADWVAAPLFEQLVEKSLDLAERLSKRRIDADPKDADILSRHAIFLDKKRRDPGGANMYYQRALAADPNDVRILGNYAVFLEERGDTTGAETYYQRALAAAPKHSGVLGNYADFLDKRGDTTGAETYYQRALAADPKHSGVLGNYAVFLDKRGDTTGAETYHQRALAADPNDARILGNYAVFLKKRGDTTGAETYYQRALAADPTHANNLGNYGQFLTGLNRLTEGRAALLSVLKYIDQSDFGSMAETCFSLWLVSRMTGQDAQPWERGFKFAIQQQFERSPWDFNRMLEQAEKTLKPEELEYAKAMASAFLDADKVANLEQYERWRALEPLDPRGLAKTATI